MSQQPYTCSLDPDTKTSIKIYLFQNLRNVEDIKNNITNGSWRCAAINPKMILDVFQVVVAANRAVVAEKLNSMVARSVYVEILFNLSLNSGISQSLSLFGIENDTTNLLICFLVTPERDDSEEIVAQIQGEMRPISDLRLFTNIMEVKSAYKLNNLRGSVSLLDIIVSRMAVKGTLSH